MTLHKAFTENMNNKWRPLPVFIPFATALRIFVNNSTSSSSLKPPEKSLMSIVYVKMSQKMCTSLVGTCTCIPIVVKGYKRLK